MALSPTFGAPGKGTIGATTPTSRAGYGNYNKAKDVLKNVFAKTGNDANSVMQRTKAYVDSQKPQTQTYYGGGGGGGDYSIAYEQPDYSEWFNALTAINNQKYDALRKAFAEQKQRADEMNNMNFARNLREWRKMYADRRNGQGLTNRLGISYARDNNSREINNTFNENNLNAIAGRYTDLASLTSQLPNMNSDTIKKIMSTVGSWNI